MDQNSIAGEVYVIQGENGVNSDYATMLAIVTFKIYP